MIGRRARMWAGITLLTVLAVNYAIIGIPLFRKAASIETRYTAAMTKQLKGPGGLFKNTDDEYLVEIFRRERTAVARNLLVLNAIALSCLILIGSWTVFGLVGSKERNASGAGGQ